MTQRLWIWSDLHQEWDDNAWKPAVHAPPDGFDVAVVVGDVHTPLTRALDWLAERLRGVPVVYVPGNHDFWWDRGEERYTLADQLSRGRDVAARYGIHLLLDEAVVIGGTRFVGGTLWTDFRLGPFGLHAAMRAAQGRGGMNDYRRIRTGRTHGIASSRARSSPCIGGPAPSLRRRLRRRTTVRQSSSPTTRRTRTASRTRTRISAGATPRTCAT